MSNDFGPTDFAARFLWSIGLIELVRRIRKGRRHVLVFHGISSQRYPDIPRSKQPWHSAAELTQVLRWLSKRYAFLTPKAYMERDDPGVLLTFDDGLANNFFHALPVLEEFEAPAIFFVSTQHVIEPQNWLRQMRQIARQQWGSETKVPESIGYEFFDGMTAEQLAACGQHPLITIGGHSISHPRLTDCDDKTLMDELADSRRFLQSVSNQPVTTMAYPTGVYDRRVVEAVQKAGYQAGFAVASSRLGFPQFEIERIGIYKAYPGYLGLKLCAFSY